MLQVEPPVARLLELDKVAPLEAKYMPSRNRRWHMYNCKEGAGKNPLRRTFLRGLVRHLNSPAVLAATYSGNAERVVSAAVDELEEALVGGCDEWLVSSVIADSLIDRHAQAVGCTAVFALPDAWQIVIQCNISPAQH